MGNYNTKKRTHERISASEFIRRYKKDPKLVEGARVIAPRMGQADFGTFRVKRNRPCYEVLEPALEACE